MRINTLLTAVTLSLISGGCLEMEEYEIGVLSEHVERPNDTRMNGAGFNGIRFNGIRFNGIRFNGIRFNGVSLTGTMFSGTEETTSLPKSGSQFVNTTMEAILNNGQNTVVTLEIRNMTEIGFTGSGVFAYEVEYEDPFSPGTMVNICGSERWAVPVDSTWDEAEGKQTTVNGSEFTFACRGAALAKCVEWGYKDKGSLLVFNPSNGTQSHALSLSDFHQACTRMVRADYCGDGTAHTKDGTLIDVFDNVGIQNPTPAGVLGSEFTLEAEWTTSGARCIQRTRFTGTNPSLGITDQNYILNTPECPDRLAENDPYCDQMANSDFFINNIYNAPSATRALLRNLSANNASY